MGQVDSNLRSPDRSNIMTDIDQLSSNNMALAISSSVQSPIKDTDTELYPIENGDESGENFQLQLSDEEEPSNWYSDKESNDKIVTTEMVEEPQSSQDSPLQEEIQAIADKYLKEKTKNVANDELNEKTNGIVNGLEPISLKEIAGSIVDKINKINEETETSPINATECEDINITSVLMENTDYTPEESTVKGTEDDQFMESDTPTENPSTESESTENLEHSNSELLKDQIMDTEDLLTIVDKEGDDKDEASRESSDKSDNDDEMSDSKPNTERDNEIEIDETNVNDTDRIEGDGDIDVEYTTLSSVSEETEEKTTEVEVPVEVKKSEEEILLVEEKNEKTEIPTPKRSSASPEPANAKKIKLSETPNTNTNIQVMNTLSKFMKQRTLKQITRKQLEHLCLQKMCEAIAYKSELGELRHQLQQQEQMIETWRKDSQTLSKQARDLDIVNRRLLSEIRQRFEREKPIVPVKITRSVGLQVKLENITNLLPRRTRTKTIAVSTASVAATPTLLKQMQMAPTKQVKITPLKTTAVTNGPPAPPLTSIVSPAVTLTPNKVVVGNSFIDLTDEDDKKGIKQGAVTTTASVVNAAAPRIMYFYSNQIPQGVLTQSAQKLMLKVNSNVVSPTTTTTSTATVNGTNTIARVKTSPKVVTTTMRPPMITPRPISKLKAVKHPAPLPPSPPLQQNNIISRKPVPPKPHLSIRRSAGGIVLSWKMPYQLEYYEEIASYQLYAYQETNSPPSTEMWRKVGDVKALALPMACTLTQFADGNKYYFAVRAVDIEKRMGPFSTAEQIML